MRKDIAYAATVPLFLFASLLVIPTTSTLPSEYVAYTGFEPPSQCPSSEGYAPNIWEDGNWTTYMLMRRGSTQNRIVQNFTDAGQTIQPKSGGHCLEMHFNQSEAQWAGTEKRDYAHSRLTMHLCNPPFPYYYQSAWYYIPKNWNMSNTEGNGKGTDRAWWEFISYREENRSSPPAPVPDARRAGGIVIGQDSPWNGTQDMFWEVGWGWSSRNETEPDSSFSYHIEPDDWRGRKKTNGSIVRCNPHEVPTGRWFRMEFYLYRHETDGIMSFWITDPDNYNASRRETRLLFEIRGEKTFEYRDQTPDEGVTIAKMYMTRNQTQFPTHLWVDDVYVSVRAPDYVPPKTFHVYDGLWHTSNFHILISAVDDSSGVAETYYVINGGQIKTVSAHGQPLITLESANNTLEYWTVDNAGNEELPHKILTGIKLDKTAPDGSITINNESAYATSTSVTLTLTATDDTSSVHQVRFSNDGVWDIEPWECPSPTKTWTLTSGDGTRTAYFQVKDNAGLVSTTYLDTIILDTAPPTANAGENQTLAEGMLVTFDGSASTDENGIKSYTWTFIDVTPQTLSGKNPTCNFTTSDTYLVTLTVEDAAGNTATDAVTITILLDTDRDGVTDIMDLDDDNDGMADTWEIENGLDPLKTADGSLDPDGDGLTNLKEYQRGTNPNVSDAEASPIWIVGVAVVIMGIVVAFVLWRRRK